MGGSSKKVVFIVDTTTQRILNDDSLRNMNIITSLKTKRVDNYGLRNSQVDYMNAGKSVFTNYYNFSKWYSPDRLPECYVSGITIPKDNITQYLANKHNTSIKNIKILSCNYTVPYESQWVNYFLVDHRGFNSNLNTFIKDGKYYLYKGYKPIPPNIECSLEGVKNTVKIDKTVTTIAITPNDKDTETKYTLITQEIITTDFHTGSFLFIETNEISSSTEIVPIGTVSPSITEVENSRTIVDVPDAYDTTITIPQSPSNNGYVAEYEVFNKSYIWIYYPSLGTDSSIEQVFIPTIPSPEDKPTSLVDAMPVTVLRDNYFNINDYDKPTPRFIPAGDGKLRADRSTKLTKDRFVQVDKILNGINVSVEEIFKGFNENPDEQYLSDAFLMVGVVPSDKHHIVSKALYETIIYFDSIIGLDESQKHVYFSEEPYNVDYSWTAYKRTSEDKVIGKVGSYSHEIGSTIKGEGIIYTDLVKAVYIPFGVLKMYTEYEEKYYYVTEYKEIDGEYKEVTTKVIINKDVKVNYLVDRNIKPYEIRTNLYTEEAKSAPLVLRKQITLTKCDAIYLYGFSGKTVIGRQYTDNVSDGTSNDNFIIPLFTSILEKFTPMECIELLERSLRVVMYVAKLHIEKLKWYQTGIFKTFLQIISFIIMAVTAYFTGGASTASTAALFSSIFSSVVIGVGVQIALNIIVTVVDSPFLKAVLMIAVVVSSAIASGAINMSAISDTVIMTGVELLNTTNMFINDMTMDGMKVLNNNIAKFSELYKNKLTEYEDKIKQFEEGITLENLLDINRSSNVYEDDIYVVDPSTYYDNIFNSYTNYDTLYSGNYDYLTSSSYNNLLTIK